MKKTILILVKLFIVLYIFGQGKYFVEGQINPLLVPIGELGFKEYGLGHFEFNYKEKITQEYIIQGGINVKSNFEVGMGVSYKKFTSLFDYTITNPGFPENVLNFEEGHLISHLYGCRIFGGFSINDRLKLRLTLEYNDPQEVDYSPKSNLGQIRFFTGVDENGELVLLGLSKDEWVGVSSGPAADYLTEISAFYKVFKNTQISCGIKYRWWPDKKCAYRLYLSGQTLDQPNEQRTLNDSRICNNVLMVYLGINYQLSFDLKRKN